MSNMYMKFVVAITQKLSAAPDSDAKVDLIEELSDNLYGRYQDMVASGMPEDEAYTTALDKLGDVNELLAYLDCCGSQPPRPDGAWQDSTADDWFSSLSGILRQTMDQAVNAANDAAAMVRDAAKRFDGNVVINMGGRRTPTAAGQELEVPSGGLDKITVSFKGDLTVYLDDDPDASIRLAGDTDDLLVETDDGALTVTQDRSAGGSFFFSRGLSSPSIKLTIPRRHWDRLELSTGSGDVEIRDGALMADTISLKTSSGDIELDDLHLSQRLEVETSSGDLDLSNSVCNELFFRSASGDLEGHNVTAAVLAQTASGDVSLSGEIRALKADTASGDLELQTGLLPEALELSTKSGDCSVSLPDSDGFVVRYSTVSGELSSELPLTDAGAGQARRAGRAGEARYQDGGDGRVFTLSTISGDIELRKN